MSLTVTLYAWWLVPYLAIGVVVLPCVLHAAWSRLGGSRPTFLRWLRIVAEWEYVLIVLLWPAAVWRMVVAK